MDIERHAFAGASAFTLEHRRKHALTSANANFAHRCSRQGATRSAELHANVVARDEERAWHADECEFVVGRECR